jgi:hypothetical protein
MAGFINFTDFSDRVQRASINVELDELIERAAMATPRLSRGYLGASAVGSECGRKVVFDWMSSSIIGAKQQRRFDRGHALEATMKAQLVAAGVTFAPPEALEFQALDYLKGHADGLIMDGPASIRARMELPALWENKALYAKGFRSIVKNGLAQAYPVYASQVCLYQHFLNRRNPALFTAINADSAEAVHMLVPFDRERLEHTLERIALIIEATKEGRLLERAYQSPDDWHCVAQCGHRARCWKLP